MLLDKDTELERLCSVVLPSLRDAVNSRAGLDAADQADVFDLLGQITFVEARIDKLEQRVSSPVATATPDGVAGVGKTLLVDFGDGPEQLTLVDGSPGPGQMSVSSPVGAAVTGKKAGDVVRVTLPNGANVDITVVSVRGS